MPPTPPLPRATPPWRVRRRAGVVLLLLATATATATTAASAPQPAPTQGPDTLLALPATRLAPAPGADPAFDQRVKAIASRLRCPVCQGESIQDSPAELAGQMKELVREQLASGMTEQQITDYFVTGYGQWILLEPRAEGINLLVYWLPVLFVCVGAGALWVTVRRWTRSGAAEAPAGVSPPDEEPPSAAA